MPANLLNFCFEIFMVLVHTYLLLLSGYYIKFFISFLYSFSLPDRIVCHFDNLSLIWFWKEYGNRGKEHSNIGTMQNRSSALCSWFGNVDHGYYSPTCGILPRLDKRLYRQLRFVHNCTKFTTHTFLSHVDS